MKKKILYSILLIVFTCSLGYAQTGIGTTTPDASAKLDVSSNNKGFLPPRVTLTSSTDNTTISNPAIGLLVYNTGNNASIVAGYYYWNGSSWATIATAQGSGVSASFMRGSRSTAQTSNLTANSLVAFTQVDYSSGQDISLNNTTGQITLAAGRTYRLLGHVPSFTSGSGGLSLCWYNESNSSWIGSQSVSYAPTSSAAYGAVGGLAEAIITTTTTSVVISFRITTGTSVTGLGGNTDFFTSNSFPWFDIQVISGNAPFNQYNFGDVKTGFQTADHSGWIKLNGRAKSTLSATQQVQATALGIGTNLPDASNAFLVQNGNTAGTVAGSNTKTITQANLPNVTLGGTTSTDGSHSHSINVNDNTVIVVSGGTVTAMKEGNNNWTAGSTVSNANVISAAGSHSHTITTSSINGGVTQTTLDITPKTLSVNTFIYLGY
jgi:ribosomal protein L31